MGIVTLTGDLGSMGDVGTLVAAQLGYRLVGREIVDEAARSLGWSQEQAEAFDERTGGFRRWLSDLLERNAAQAMGSDEIGAYATTYGVAVSAVGASSDRYLDALRTAMAAFANQDNVVLVGRGGQAMFADRPDAVHVRVVCPLEERIRRIARRDRTDLTMALTTVEESDRQREAWHRKYFGIDYRSPYHYSLAVNTGKLTDVLAAEVVVCIARQQAAVMAR